MAKEKQETVYHEECIITAFCTAIALQSIHLFKVSFRVVASFFAHSPLPVYKQMEQL